jgi:hypothetical protein
MNGLDLHMPSVEETDLGEDNQNAALMRVLRALRVKGLKYRDPYEHEKDGHDAVMARTLAWAHMQNKDLDHKYTITCDVGGPLEIVCNACGVDLDINTSSDDRTIARTMRRHVGACEGNCPHCKMSSKSLHVEYLESFFDSYQKTRVRGEPQVNREAFLEALMKHKRIVEIKGGGMGQRIFMSHTMVFSRHKSKGNGGELLCKTFHTEKDMFMDYVHHHGTDAVKKKLVEDHPGDEYEERLRRFRKNHYVSNTDGTYGKMRNYGHRAAIIAAIHQYVLAEETKGTKKITSWFPSSKK